MYPHVPPGYIIRAATEDDIPAILALLRDFDTAVMGEVEPLTRDTILGDWSDLDTRRDTWLVLAPDGLIAGYAKLTDYGAGRFFADGYVHPTQQGLGIGSTLVAAAEARAATLISTQSTETRLVLVNHVSADSTPARTLLEARGYTFARVYFRMRITLEELPPAPVWPAKISVRGCDGSQADVQRAYEAVEEGFKDHWEHIPRSFAHWQRQMFSQPVDPSLWFLAQEGNHVAGAALCQRREDGSGRVNELVVLRPWRRQGLGLALLRHAFTIFYERGVRKVGLGVDGQSLTGAQRLYERAGMHIASRLARYEKELLPGKDLMDES
jgi:ribosomal protein S18 acetylase RimI-like enzyme